MSKAAALDASALLCLLNGEPGSERVYATLRRQILRLDLRPGEDLDEGAVSGRLAVSRTPVREALARLAKARLLPPEDAAALIRADRFWRSIQAMLRLTVGRPRTEALPAAAVTALLRVCAPYMADGAAESAAPVDLAALRGVMEPLNRLLLAAPRPAGG